MGFLADDVLRLIRTRADVSYWRAANEHGRQMHEAIDLLEASEPTTDPAEFFEVVHKLASAVRVIARADDSSGIIGDACRRLLELHPRAAAAAAVPASRLIAWMMKFQFEGEVDYFELDPVTYARALGEPGMRRYRVKLDEVRSGLGPEPDAGKIWESEHSHEWFVIGWNERRLAVLDRDIDAIIRTHARDRRVAAWLEDAAEAFEEIGEIDLAIDWAKQATDFGLGHQSVKAASYWCKLIAGHRPDDVVGARAYVFRRWPSSSTGAELHRAADAAWPEYRDEVLDTLARSPRDAVLFALLTLDDAEFAWELAHALMLTDDDVWERLAKAYERIDPIAVLPVLRRLVEHELTATGAQHYQIAARRLKRMRQLAASSHADATDVDAFIAKLRETHRRRPRLQHEFTRCRLP